MKIKSLLISYAIACTAAGILSLVFIPSQNGPALLVVIPVALAFMGPVSELLVGQYVPMALTSALVTVGVVGAILAVLGFNKDNSKVMHIGNALWAISGASITVVGLVASCC